MRPTTVFLASCVSLLSVTAMAETVVDESAARAAMGMRGSGQFLIVDAEKACSFVEPIFRSADPQDRILIFSDTDVALLGQGNCDGECDDVTLNRLMTTCQQETGGICAPVAGIHDGKLYDLSVDATGKTFAACGL